MAGGEPGRGLQNAQLAGAGTPRLVPRVPPRERRRGPRLGLPRRQSQRLLGQLCHPHRHPRLRPRPARQRPPRAAGPGLRRRRTLRVHVHRRPAQHPWRHRLAREPHSVVVRPPRKSSGDSFICVIPAEAGIQQPVDYAGDARGQPTASSPPNRWIEDCRSGFRPSPERRRFVRRASRRPEGRSPPQAG